MEPRQKIYIASNGSSAMTLEGICQSGKSETKRKGNFGDFLRLYLVGTNEELDDLQDRNRELMYSYGATTFLEAAIGMGFYAAAGCSYLADRTVPLEYVGAAMYLFADHFHRWRSRSEDCEIYREASGIIGSIRGAIKKARSEARAKEKES